MYENIRVLPWGVTNNKRAGQPALLCSLISALIFSYWKIYLYLYLLHYCLRFSTCQIHIKNTLKTQVIPTVFSTRNQNSQPLLVTDIGLSCSVTHLPVYQLIHLIYQHKLTYILAYQRNTALQSIAA